MKCFVLFSRNGESPQLILEVLGQRRDGIMLLKCIQIPRGIEMPQVWLNRWREEVLYLICNVLLLLLRDRPTSFGFLTSQDSTLDSAPSCKWGQFFSSISIKVLQIYSKPPPSALQLQLKQLTRLETAPFSPLWPTSARIYPHRKNFQSVAVGW
jgi:hypothetical protein